MLEKDKVFETSPDNTDINDKKDIDDGEVWDIIEETDINSDLDEREFKCYNTKSSKMRNPNVRKMRNRDLKSLLLFIGCCYEVVMQV